MINISLNATRVKQEIRRVAYGIGLMIPVFLLFFAGKALVHYGLLDTRTIGTFFMIASLTFLCWSLGGLFETLRAHREQKTLQAFQKLGHTNNDNN